MVLKQKPGKANVTMLKTYITPIITHGCETWNIPEKEMAYGACYSEMRFISVVRGLSCANKVG